MDTIASTVIGHVAIGGYVDSYFTYNFNRPADNVNPYFVSSAKHNELTINLAYVDVRYKSKYMRARFVPGFGTYMDANYKNEPGSLKNMVEANVGVLIWEKKRIWLDIGVLGSPYTNESAISKDHLMYTRSFAPENVPYYVTGARVTVPVSEKVNAYLYVINGWQVIEDNNQGKSFATQVEYRPNNKMLLNWNTYVGDERSRTRPNLRTRYLNDFYWIYNPGGKISAT
ncbi:MAG: porin, partial [Cyclobacteriaceae bacterium]|nr:porin [Cyclobacteriaceae bacterium]